MTFRSALITGATGFIGSALVRHLISQGTEVWCAVRSQTPAERLTRVPGAKILRTSYEQGSVCRDFLDVRPDVIFNLASYGVHPAERHPEALIQGNMGVLCRILEFAAERGVPKIIHAGSCAEYGESTDELTPITESATLRPLSVYGAAKAAAELYGVALAQSLGVNLVTLRIFNVYGEGEAAERLLPAIISHLDRDLPIGLTGGEQVRDITYVDDVAHALALAADAESLKSGDAYNVCTGLGRTVREIAETAAQKMNKPRELLQWGKVPYRNDEPMWLVGSNMKFACATGWSPRIELQEGIARMLKARAIVAGKELS